MKFDLQDRLINYAVRIIRLSLPKTTAGRHISSQIMRSGTASAPNYGEAQSAESKADFVHKLKLSLKELRETEVWIKMIIKAEMIKPASQLESLLNETDELIAIFFRALARLRSKNLDDNFFTLNIDYSLLDIGY